MPTAEVQRVMETAYTVARLTGMLMLVTAAGISLLLLLTVAQILLTPESVGLVQLIDDFLLAATTTTWNQASTSTPAEAALRFVRQSD
ncbi:MAG: hypothetical protein OET44_13735 [Gammaproteobacteria bacterium]|nr:hypothetical protein [Gammaproteobacteria bacterium]